jgi:hypothetical protein
LAVDWTTVGAIAGPVLALISLGLQGKDRLRKPVVTRETAGPNVNDVRIIN